MFLDISTIGGIVAAVVFIVVSISMGGSLGAFIDAPSIFIVVGGVLASTFASYPLKKFLGLINIMKNAFTSKKVDIHADVEKIIEIANIARRNGIIALDELTDSMEDPFLKKGIMLIVDGSDPELIQGILETELAFIKERHAEGRSILETMSAYSPAFGMIGTLIGLINMLKNLSDMAALGPGMSVALVTTFYGTFLANVVFGPLSKKLKSIGNDEYLRKELLLEGILSINGGENPRIIREKLNAFLSRAQLRDTQTSLGKQGDTEDGGGNG